MENVIYIPRTIDSALLEWKDDLFRKPMLLRGARQTGKTTAVRNFARRFDSFVELNFEKDPRLPGIFEPSHPYEGERHRPGAADIAGKPRHYGRHPPGSALHDRRVEAPSRRRSLKHRGKRHSPHHFGGCTTMVRDKSKTFPSGDVSFRCTTTSCVS